MLPPLGIKSNVFWDIHHLIFSPTQKKEATCSFKMLVTIYQTTVNPPFKVSSRINGFEQKTEEIQHWDYGLGVNGIEHWMKDHLTFGNIKWGPTVHSIITRRLQIWKLGFITSVVPYVSWLFVLLFMTSLSDDGDRNGLQIPIPCQHRWLYTKLHYIRSQCKDYTYFLLYNCPRLHYSENKIDCSLVDNYWLLNAKQQWNPCDK
jgi:hypothetical protein